MGNMRIKFNKQITVDFMDNHDEVGSKTFYPSQIIEVVGIEETAKGFVDLIFDDGSYAIGIPKGGLTIL